MQLVIIFITLNTKIGKCSSFTSDSNDNKELQNRANTKYIGNHSKWQEAGKLSCSKKS